MHKHNKTIFRIFSQNSDSDSGFVNENMKYKLIFGKTKDANGREFHRVSTSYELSSQIHKLFKRFQKTVFFKHTEIWKIYIPPRRLVSSVIKHY